MVGDRVAAVDEDDVQTLGEGLEIGPVHNMAVSPNGKLLTTFAHDGRLLVIPKDFSRIIFEYECDVSSLLVLHCLLCNLYLGSGIDFSRIIFFFFFGYFVVILSF